MMMMALPELNIDLLMMTMLVIWITMHMNSQGFDEPPAPYLTPPLPNNSLPHAHVAQRPHKPNTPLLHPLRQYARSIPRIQLLAKIRRYRAFAILPSNASFGSCVAWHCSGNRVSVARSVARSALSSLYVQAL